MVTKRESRLKTLLKRRELAEKNGSPEEFENQLRNERMKSKALFDEEFDSRLRLVANNN